VTSWPDISSLRALGFAAGGIAYLALAAFLLRARPRRRPSLALAAYCMLYGILAIEIGARISGVVLPGLETPPAQLAFAFALERTVWLCLLLFALWLPRPRPGPWPVHRPVALAAVAWAVIIAAESVITALTFDRWLAARPDLFGTLGVLGVAGGLLNPTWFMLTLLLLRFALAPEGSARDRRQAALMSVAVSLLLATGAGGALSHPSNYDAASRTFSLVLFVALAASWLLVAARSRGADARLARNTALALLAAPVVMALAATQLGLFGFQLGFSFVVTAALLTYAILRHQLLGLDLKVKWTLRQSTVAAAFIGVFFVVSESASSFLATEGGLGTYLGIAAAGLLVFAIAPLQRAAERVASAAMPGVKSAFEMTPRERVNAYREAALAAWADGHVTHDERFMLERLRNALRLSHEEAGALEMEAARQTHAAGKASRSGARAGRRA
jgi:hypothetical protein